MVEFLEKVQALSLKLDLVFPHQSIAEECLLFSVFLVRKRKVFLAEENSCLCKRKLLKYNESSPILVFHGTLSLEMAL